MPNSLLSVLSLFFLSFSFFLVIYCFSLPACTEAYSQSDEQYACHLGCQNQLPYAELRQEQVRNNTALQKCLLRLHFVLKCILFT